MIFVVELMQSRWDSGKQPGPFLSEVSPATAVLVQADIGRERTSSASEREGEEYGDKGLS